MSKFDETFGKARVFIYRNARPVDLARWRYHFEDGNREDVLTALAAYQNADGGFGHGLEADNFNPNSNPMHTWNACEILREIGFEDGSYAVPWIWYNDYKEFTLAENWWKSILLIKYMGFLREFG